MSDKQMSVAELFEALRADAAGDEPRHLEVQASIVKMKADCAASGMSDDQLRIGLLAFRREIQRRLEGRRGWLEKMVKVAEARNALIGKPPAG